MYLSAIGPSIPPKSSVVPTRIKPPAHHHKFTDAIWCNADDRRSAVGEDCRQGREVEVLRADQELFNDARRRNVIIVTPTSLFCMLHLVQSLWSFHDKQNNALEIAEQGRQLLKKLGTFVDSFMDVGNRLSGAMDTFEKAKGQLHTGKGNLIGVAKRMTSLGVEAPVKGELPALMLEAHEEGDAEVIPLPHISTPAG